jgi:hypothetical protein
MRNAADGFRSLGVLWLVYGCLRVIEAAVLVIYGGTLALMWGSLLTRVPNPNVLMTLFHVGLVLAVAWCIVSAFFAFLAGGALLKGAVVARMEVLVAGLLALPDLPFGVMLGVYTVARVLPRTSFVVERVQPSATFVMPLEHRSSR